MEEALSLTILIPVFFTAIISFLLLPSHKKRSLPPGPPSIPILGSLLWLRHPTSLSNLETIIRNLRSQLGPIITLRFGSQPYIFIADRSLAHRALVELGASFSSRPPPLPSSPFLNARISTITSSPYGDHWRLLRRNLTSEILNPTKIRLFADGRRWVLNLLIRDLQTKAEQSPQGAVVPMESFQLAMFGLLVLMCFGEKLDEQAIKEIETSQRELLLHSGKKLLVFAFVPKLLSRSMFQGRLRTVERLRQKQRDLFLPLIRARRENQKQGGEERFVYSYVDSLLDITVPEEGVSKLTDNEIINLCSEFLIAGTDTTATALQWTMAEIVARSDVQAKLVKELEALNGEELKEEDLQKLPYLKAVVLEGLRRHPPVHFVVPHSVVNDVEFEGYLIPKNTSINFNVADLGWDEKVWKEPMEFKPERFMAGGDGEGVDITGSREIKMMPFGVGRRICPAVGLAMLHLEYFIANLVREFQWDAVEGEEIDFTETTVFTIAMKKPLRARITQRRKAY
ncbi:cytochrome P450 89A2-like [Phalaenopsis equestris]|uniref:cytochrome P450 89A2-like n=1 Tax=Phalaenopsis equestris TaxID=78828 RepID=UPI0009E65710|nr:cytochrome P450 89A2-like [Phalaenopsis equestris]